MLIHAQNSSWKKYTQLLKICKEWVRESYFWFLFVFFIKMIHKHLELSLSTSNRPVKLNMIILINTKI